MDLVGALVLQLAALRLLLGLAAGRLHRQLLARELRARPAHARAAAELRAAGGEIGPGEESQLRRPPRGSSSRRERGVRVHRWTSSVPTSSMSRLLTSSESSRASQARSLSRRAWRASSPSSPAEGRWDRCAFQYSRSLRRTRDASLAAHVVLLIYKTLEGSRAATDTRAVSRNKSTRRRAPFAGPPVPWRPRSAQTASGRRPRTLACVCRMHRGRVGLEGNVVGPRHPRA